VVEPQANRSEQALFHRPGEAAWTRFITGRYYATSTAGMGGQQRLGNSWYYGDSAFNQVN
jgi:hypothetical protein